MRRQGLCVMVLGLVLVGFAAVAQEKAAEPTLDSVLKAITEKLTGLTSLSASLGADASVPGAGENKMQVKGTGTTEFMKNGEKVCVRLDLGVRPAAATPEMKPMAEVSAVFDGAKGAALVTLFGKTEYYVLPSEVLAFIESSEGSLMDKLNENFSLKLLPDEKFNDQDSYVIEGAPTFDTGDIPVGGLKLYFSKETGVPVQIAALDQNGEVLLAATPSEVKLNDSIDASRFVVPVAPPPVEEPAAAEAKETEKPVEKTDEKAKEPAAEKK